MDFLTCKHIEMRPSAIHRQKACIVGTRIRVEDIYVWHEVQGRSPHEIVTSFPELSLADVHAAMAYYWDNRECIQEQMKKGHEVAQQIREENPPKLPTKLATNDVEVDGKPYNATSINKFISKGNSVRIVDRQGMNLVVEELVNEVD